MKKKFLGDEIAAEPRGSAGIITKGAPLSTKFAIHTTLITLKFITEIVSVNALRDRK